MKELDEANLLNSEIRELKFFINALDVSEYRRNSNITSIIKKRVEQKTTYWIFGRRFFGTGAHEHTVNVPTSMIPTIVIEAKALLIVKETELKNLFNKP